MLTAAVMWLMLASTAKADPCASATSVADVDERLAAAEASYWALKQQAFEAEATAAQEALRCIGGPVTQELAARLHRVEGLRAWLRHDAEATSRAFTVAKWLDRGYQFPVELPVEAPERSVYDRVAGDAPRTAPVSPPPTGTFSFDAQLGPNRPQERPTVFQHIDADDHPIETMYLASADALPVTPPPVEPSKRRGRPAGQWIAGGASVGLLAAGAIVYGSGRWGYDQDAYTNLAKNNPDAADEFYRTDLYPRFAVGIGLAVAGGAGLLGTGAWVIATPRMGGVGFSGRW